jgi:DNA-binding transcriptional LysR family regulator
MNTQHLETFVKVVQLKSFTKAAEELCLTQPTVSKQIVDLEKAFQVRLIDRTKRSVALTKAGEVLFGYAREFVSLKREAIEALAGFVGLRRGTLRLGASSIPGVYILPPILKEFNGQFPGVELTLSLSDSKDITTKVENGDVDVGFVGSREETTRIAYRTFLEDRIVLIGPADFEPVIRIDSLRDCPLLVREQGSGTRRFLESALSRKDVRAQELRIVGELGDTEAIKAAVKAGMGVSFVSNRAIREDVDRALLKVIDVKGFPPVRRPFYVITRKGRSLSPQSAALLKIVDEWRQHADV